MNRDQEEGLKQIGEEKLECYLLDVISKEKCSTKRIIISDWLRETLKDYAAYKARGRKVSPSVLA